MNNPAKIAVIILNWKNHRLTIDCLQGVLKSRYDAFDCIVVDNGSGDGSEQIIQSWLAENLIRQPEPLKITGLVGSYKSGRSAVVFLQTGENLGYSGGNNAGIKAALELGCDHALILNNDSQMDPRFLSGLAWAASQSGADIAGALVRDEAGEKILFSGYGLWPALLTGFFQAPLKPDLKKEWWPSGCVQGSAMMLSRGLLERRVKELGYYLDPSLFMYNEEIELGLWGKKNGVLSIVTSRAVLRHSSGASSGPYQQYYYLTRNRLLLAKRFLGYPGHALYLALFIPVRAAAALKLELTGRAAESRAVLLGLVHGMKDISGPHQWPKGS
jgi:GT2 family glycosyltransferase